MELSVLFLLVSLRPAYAYGNPGLSDRALVAYTTSRTFVSGINQYFV